MVEFLRGLAQFLSRMDAKAATSLAISISLLLFVLFMLAFGQQWLNLDEEGKLGRILLATSQSPWAVVGVISVFSLLAMTGFPQILLITATVIVFGPRLGAAYAWLATMASASLTFGLGHFLGSRWVRRFGGERMQRLINFLSRHGILASGLIRVVPSAPFLVVNAAAGAAHIPLWKYWMGTGFGIIPKIAVVALLAVIAPTTTGLEHNVDGIVEFFLSREPRDIALIAAIIVLWVGFLILMRWLYKRLRAEERAY